MLKPPYMEAEPGNGGELQRACRNWNHDAQAPNPPAAAQEIYDLGPSTPLLQASIADLPNGTYCDESAPGAEQAGDGSTGAIE